MSARAHGLLGEVNRDVIPAVHGGGDGIGALGVGGAQIGDRLVGEHDAPAERVVRAMPFDHGDLRTRVAPLHEQRGIEPAGTTTNDDNVHRMRSGKGYPLTVRPITSNIK